MREFGSTIRAVVLVAVLVATATSVVACSRRTKLNEPAAAVQGLLELRSRNATDVASYERYVESTTVAGALAAESIISTLGTQPTPSWETPEVSKQATSTASVRVTWEKSSRFKDWPAVTTFLLRLNRGEWRVIDAIEATVSTDATQTP